MGPRGCSLPLGASSTSIIREMTIENIIIALFGAGFGFLCNMICEIRSDLRDLIADMKALVREMEKDSTSSSRL